MAEKPKTNVDKFFEIYDADPALQARVQQAMDSYPGSLEIRDVMTEHVLLPVAEELGLPFTLKELRNYELLKWGRQHQDRELTEQDMAVDYETTYWLHHRKHSKVHKTTASRRETLPVPADKPHLSPQMKPTMF